MTKQNKIRLISAIMFVGICAAILFHFVYMDRVLHKPYPYNTFLFRPENRFGDWINPYYGLLSRWPLPNPGHVTQTLPQYMVGQVPMKPGLAPLELPYCLAALTRMNDETLLFTFLAVFTLLFFLLNYYYLNLGFRLMSFVYTAIWTFSYPYLFAVDRANIDGYLMLIFAAAIYLHANGKRAGGSLLMGVLSSMKPPLGIYSLIYIYEKRWLYFFLSSALSIVIYISCNHLLPYLYTGSYQETTEIVKWYTRYLEVGATGIYFGHSFFGAFRTICYMIFYQYKYSDEDAQAFFTRTLVYYSIFSGIVSLCVMIYMYFRKMALWEILTCLCCLMCLMPFVSADYRLLYFFIPMLLFVNAKTPHSNDLYIAILFGLLVIPKDYIHLTINGEENVVAFEASSSVLLNPLILLLLLVACLWKLPRRQKEDTVLSE